MSEAVEFEADSADSFERPGAEMDKLRGPIPNVDELALEDINPVWNRLFAENRSLEYFQRLRRDDPVHFNETDLAGRYWSLTKYSDIKAVDTDHHNFSSAYGITLGFPIDRPLPEGALDVPMFIAMDPPRHDV